MARNGTDFGIRVSGLGERWLTAPVTMPVGMYFPGYSADNANPDILANCVLLGGNMTLVCPPAIGVKPRDPKRLQEVLKFKEDRILPTPKDIRQHGATVMINRMPQPSRLGFLAHVAPHLIQF